ncbi:MAG TPA: hypothetical protein VFB22_17005 [Candidatus Baltobacteraceae bacterium]|nr:hypothetical protein [Candidatus Baltobacteraceae bacterium]
MPPPPPNRSAHAIHLSRAVFGVGFVALGALAFARVALAAAPPGSKIVGGALGLAMIALGLVRIGLYVRWRRGAG